MFQWEMRIWIYSGVLYENALAYLTGTFGLHGIAMEDIKGMVINNYNANRGDFGKDRMRLYLKKKRAGTIEIKSWKGNKNKELFSPS